MLSGPQNYAEWIQSYAEWTPNDTEWTPELLWLDPRATLTGPQNYAEWTPELRWVDPRTTLSGPQSYADRQKPDAKDDMSSGSMYMKCPEKANLQRQTVEL